MIDVVSTFPLFRLPTNAILKTFRSMDYLRIYGISILSKKSKNLVKSLKITADLFHVEVNDTFEINLYFAPDYSRLHFKLYQVLENEPPQELGTPGNVRIVRDPMETTWTNSMSVKELIDHLKLIFHTQISTLVFKENCERFNLESVHKNVKDFKSICSVSVNEEHQRRILSLFQPVSFTLARRGLVEFCVSGDILIQNFNVIYVPCVRITLDELVMTNSRVIDLGCNISVKILNHFLKVWVKGSNPQLERLLLRFNAGYRNEELLKGLKYEDASPNRIRLFNNSGEKEIEKVTGGWDIRRFDGTKATIIVQRAHNVVVIFQLYVWHDHCLVSEFDP